MPDTLVLDDNGRKASGTVVQPRVGAWSRCISHGFFLFFTSPILSPAINDKAFYFNWVLPLFDPEFLKYLHRQASRVPGHAILATVILLLWFSLMAPEAALRWLLILWPLVYLQYAYEARVFYLYTWMGVNVAIALLQAVVYLTAGPSVALLVGPKNISTVLWGEYATRTFTNFYSIVPGVDFPRFSGLSREGGFFASLLATVVLLKRSTRERIGLVLWLGIALSMSKSTAFLALGWLIVAVGTKDRRSPAVLFLPFFLAFTLFYYLFVDSLLMGGSFSATFTHRIYAYSALFHDLDLPNLLVGNRASSNVLAQFKAFQVCANLERYITCLDMPSFGALIYSTGIVGLCLYVWQLSALGITVWGVLLIFILTGTVSPLSNTSFVVMSYFLAIRLGATSRSQPRRPIPNPVSVP